MAVVSSHPAGSQVAYLFLLMWPSLEHGKVFEFGNGDMAFGIAAVVGGGFCVCGNTGNVKVSWFW